MSFSLVMSDAILEQFYRFKNKDAFDPKIIEHVLRYYKPSFITNYAQLQRIGYATDTNLLQKLIQNGLKDQSLEELVEKLILK